MAARSKHGKKKLLADLRKMKILSLLRLSVKTFRHELGLKELMGCQQTEHSGKVMPSMESVMQ